MNASTSHPLIVEVNEDNFAAEVEQAALPVFVDFWASWCGPCKALAPLFDKLAEIYEGRIKFAKVNSDQNKELAARLNVRGLPTLLLFKRGEVVERTSGAQSKSHFSNLLDRHADGLATAPIVAKPARSCRAFYGDAALRDATVERVRRPLYADQVVSGNNAPVCDEAKGEYSLMGAALHDTDAERYEGTLGIPAHVGRLEEAVHSLLTREVADAQGNTTYAFREPSRDYPLDWLQAIPLGADVRPVTSRFIHWFLHDLVDGTFPYGLTVNDEVKAAAHAVAALHLRASRDELPSAAEWKQVRSHAGGVASRQSKDGEQLFGWVVATCAEMLAWPAEELEEAVQGALGTVFFVLWRRSLRDAYSEQQWAEREALAEAARQRQVSAKEATPEQLAGFEEVKAFQAYMEKVQPTDHAQGLKAKHDYGERMHSGLMSCLAAVTAATAVP